MADRSRRGEEIERTVAECLDEFYSAGDSDSAYQMLVEEPPETDDVKLDALLAAVAEYLALQYSRNRAPKWVFHPKRILKEPLFTTSSNAPAMKEWLVHSSPAEFKSHNIFTESRPLRRKLSGRVPWMSAGRR
ncbi:MAG: hypothetical protein ABSG76_16920 [Xanthobacteraceae bacterium]